MRVWTPIVALTLCGWGSFTPLPAGDSGQARQARASGQESHVTAEPPLIHCHDGRLSVRLHHTPWRVVLAELVRHTGVRITATGPLTGTVTQEFAALPLEQGLRRLFREVNLLMLFTANGSAPTVTHVWLFPKSEREAGPPGASAARGQPGQGLPEAARGLPTAEAAAGEVAHAERLRALHASAQQGDVQALQQALFDPDPLIQATAVALVAEHDPQGATAALLGLSASAQPEQRSRSLQLLHQSGAADDETVVAALRAALADADAAVKGYAIQALAERGGAEALEDLHQAFRDPDPAIRRLVLESVIRLDEGLPLAQEALTDAEESIRALARSRLAPPGPEPR
jgi:hypothetical protein